MQNFLIAATNSGCGKTTITIGLLRTLQRRAIAVQPFKCGPDYIDTQYHQMACGEESVNLDTRFTTHEHLREVFNHYHKEVNIVEGVMGLYDGYDRWKGSSAEIAALLDIPIILIINARSMAYSAAAIIHGYTTLQLPLLGRDQRERPLRFSGVIFNQVGSERHASFLKQACVDAGVKCIGCIPRLPDMEIPSRHLGLSLENRDFIEKIICRAADAIEKYVDFKALGL